MSEHTPKTILVTGGAGFIGALVSRGASPSAAIATGSGFASTGVDSIAAAGCAPLEHPPAVRFAHLEH